MSAEQVTLTVYTCARCGSRTVVDSPSGNDMPEGVYLTMRRVTEDRNHYLTDELYCCTKECAVNLVQYGIHNNATPFRPIARKRTRWDVYGDDKPGRITA